MEPFSGQMMLRALYSQSDFGCLHCLGIITSTFWNTIECCRGLEDMKDEISSSLKASDILGLIFTECATFGLKS